jgi:Uma2 family endonuclease
MTTDVAHREFIPGTTGWSVDDLDDPEIERLWNQGRYEIVEGVLTIMPAAYYESGITLQRLLFMLRDHTVRHGLGDGFATEVDLILNKKRLARVDAIFLTPADQEKQKQAHAARGTRSDLKYGRILVPPTLLIESVSRGHESHDRETKRGWYAEARIPNYWLLDAQQRSLECLVLDGTAYRVDQSGMTDAELRPALFPGLVIALARLWVE